MNPLRQAGSHGSCALFSANQRMTRSPIVPRVAALTRPRPRERAAGSREPWPNALFSANQRMTRSPFAPRVAALTRPRPRERAAGSREP
jgi:hypothetical protein